MGLATGYKIIVERLELLDANGELLIVEEALAKLEEMGVDTGADYVPVEVTLEAGGS